MRLSCAYHSNSLDDTLTLEVTVSGETHRDVGHDLPHIEPHEMPCQFIRRLADWVEQLPWAEQTLEVDSGGLGAPSRDQKGYPAPPHPEVSEQEAYESVSTRGATRQVDPDNAKVDGDAAP